MSSTSQEETTTTVSTAEGEESTSDVNSGNVVEETQPQILPVGQEVEVMSTCTDTSLVKVDDTCFDDLIEGLNATKEGSTLTLLQNIVASGNVVISTGITLQLNGKTLTFSNDTSNYLVFAKSGTNYVIDGTVKNSRVEGVVYLSWKADNSSISINGGTYTSKWYGLATNGTVQEGFPTVGWTVKAQNAHFQGTEQ